LGHGSIVGGEADGPNPVDPRAAAAAAAQQRLELANERGTKGGKLAKQLEAQRGKGKPPSPEPPERLVWD